MYQRLRERAIAMGDALARLGKSVPLATGPLAAIGARVSERAAHAQETLASVSEMMAEVERWIDDAVPAGSSLE